MHLDCARPLMARCPDLDCAKASLRALAMMHAFFWLGHDPHGGKAQLASTLWVFCSLFTLLWHPTLWVSCLHCSLRCFGYLVYTVACGALGILFRPFVLWPCLACSNYFVCHACVGTLPCLTSGGMPHKFSILKHTYQHANKTGNRLLLAPWAAAAGPAGEHCPKLAAHPSSIRV